MMPINTRIFPPNNALNALVLSLFPLEPDHYNALFNTCSRFQKNFSLFNSKNYYNPLNTRSCVLDNIRKQKRFHSVNPDLEIIFEKETKKFIVRNKNDESLTHLIKTAHRLYWRWEEI
jgi:hypothetical protein